MDYRSGSCASYVLMLGAVLVGDPQVVAQPLAVTVMGLPLLQLDGAFEPQDTLLASNRHRAYLLERSWTAMLGQGPGSNFIALCKTAPHSVYGDIYSGRLYNSTGRFGRRRYSSLLPRHI